MQKNKWIVFVGIGIEIVAITMAAVWSGEWLDLQLDSKNTFTIVLPLIGLAGWIYHVIAMVKKTSQS
jgi:hypothetical protein